MNREFIELLYGKKKLALSNLLDSKKMGAGKRLSQTEMIYIERVAQDAKQWLEDIDDIIDRYWETHNGDR